jgi:hypothetical protein
MRSSCCYSKKTALRAVASPHTVTSADVFKVKAFKKAAIPEV